MALSPFIISAHDLPRRPGEIRQLRLEIDEHEALGFDVLAIAEDEPIDIDYTLQSVDEGVLVTGTVVSVASGECGRCLDPLEIDVDESFQDLYEYDVDPRQARKADKKKSAQKRKEEEELSEEDDEVRHMVGELIDLEGPIRDAIILNLPINPLCDPNCEGLCQGCGEKWATLPEDHSHEQIDPRWAGLAGLTGLADLIDPEAPEQK
jgi:uncharacterized protein